MSIQGSLLGAWGDRIRNAWRWKLCMWYLCGSEAADGQESQGDSTGI